MSLNSLESSLYSTDLVFLALYALNSSTLFSAMATSSGCLEISQPELKIVSQFRAFCCPSNWLELESKIQRRNSSLEISEGKLDNIFIPSYFLNLPLASCLLGEFPGIEIERESCGGNNGSGQFSCFGAGF